MITVMHRGPDGSERIFEAESVTRFAPEGEQSIPALGRVVASGVRLDDVPGTSIGLDISAPFGAVFVMNRHGATIAKWLCSPTQAIHVE